MPLMRSSREGIEEGSSILAIICKFLWNRQSHPCCVYLDVTSESLCYISLSLSSIKAR